MNDRQKETIQCAFADLCGSLQSFNQLPYKASMHDWEAHGQSILDLIKYFPELKLELPENLKHLANS